MSGAGNTSTTQQNPNPNPQVIRYGPKYTMNPPPVLGVNCPWNTWFRKIQSQAKAHKWGPMLVSKTDMLDEWDIAKNWLLEAVPDEDFDLVDQAVCWMDAIEALKKAHSIVDEVNEVNLIEKLFSLTLLPNESVTSIISRCRAINSTLKSIKSGVTDRQLLSAVMKVMRQNPAYDSVLKTMVSLTGTTMDLDSLQTAFNNVAPPPIPGAFFVKDTPVVDPPPSKPAPNPFLEAMKAMTQSISDKITSSVAMLANGNGGGNRGRGRGRGRGGRGNGGENNRFHPYGRGNGGSRGGSRGGYNYGRGGRGNGRVFGSERFEGTCYNCGKSGHRIDVCYLPCGTCGSKEHKATHCNNKKYEGRKGKAFNAYGASEEDQDYDFEMGQAFTARAVDSRMPPGFGERSCAPPSDVFGVIGKASVAALSNQGTPKHSWILDGGASHHMTPLRSVLFNYKPDDNRIWIEVANNQFVPRAGVGSLRVETTIDGNIVKKEIKNVWHVPELGRSLLSTNQLKRAGCWHISGRNGDMAEYFMDKNNKYWLECPIINGLNVPNWRVHIDVDSPPVRTFVASTYTSVPETPQANYAHSNHATDKESPELWHQRLGHIAMTNLHTLVRTKCVTGVNLPSQDIAKATCKTCQVCVMAKHNRAPFKSRVEKPDDLMHTLGSDVCGPYPVETIGGGRYVTTLVDFCSSNTDVALGKRKSDAPNDLKRMILRWENITGKKCKFLFTDRGGEYIDKALNAWLHEKGITHEFSVPRTPQQNGVAERVNQTLNNMVRAMLLQYNSYLPLWGHAMLYAVRIKNVALNARLGMTPYEAFHGKVPDVSNFRTFGCKVYARVADTQRKKLDPKSQPGLYLGPEVHGPGYKVLVWDPDLKKENKYAVHIVRDIVCFENLPAVTGAQDVSELHWGGHIPLPKPQSIPETPEQLESLTGVPSPVQPLHLSLPEWTAQVLRNANALQGRKVTPKENASPKAMANENRTSVMDKDSTHGKSVGSLLGQVPGPGGNHTPVMGNDPIHGGSRDYPLSQGLEQGGNGQNVNNKIHTSVMGEVPIHGGRKGVQPSQELGLGGKDNMKNHTFVMGEDPTHGERRDVRPSKVLRPGGNGLNGRGMSPGKDKGSFNGGSRDSYQNGDAGPSNKIRRVGLGGQEMSNQRFTRSRAAMIAMAKGPVTGKRKYATFADEQDVLSDNVEYPIIPTAFSATAPYPEPDPTKCQLPSKHELTEGLLKYFCVPEPEGPLPVISQVDTSFIPKTIKQAMECKYAKFWAEAIIDEWLSVLGNNTWELVDKEPWMRIIPCKWVFVIKTNEHGIPCRFKARLVAGGHKQTEGIDYEETYAPVSRMSTLRIMLAVAASRGWVVHQLDIKTAFLHGELDIDVYMRQPSGFVDGVNKVCKLRKCLYGLKQAPKQWYETLKSALIGIGFEPVSADSSFWVKKGDPCIVYLTTVVDDMLVASRDEHFTIEMVNAILEVFPGKHEGRANYYNGLRITWLDKERAVLLTQTAHIQKLKEKFDGVADLEVKRTLPMKEGLRLCKSGTSDVLNSELLDTERYHYRALLGGLNYISNGSRPDITFTFNQLSRYCNAPTKAHWDVAIDCLRYLIHTQNWGIKLGGGGVLGQVDWPLV